MLGILVGDVLAAVNSKSMDKLDRIYDQEIKAVMGNAFTLAFCRGKCTIISFPYLRSRILPVLC